MFTHRSSGAASVVSYDTAHSARSRHTQRGVTATSAEHHSSLHHLSNNNNDGDAGDEMLSAEHYVCPDAWRTTFARLLQQHSPAHNNNNSSSGAATASSSSASGGVHDKDAHTPHCESAVLTPYVKATTQLAAAVLPRTSVLRAACRVSPLPQLSRVKAMLRRGRAHDAHAPYTDAYEAWAAHGPHHRSRSRHHATTTAAAAARTKSARYSTTTTTRRRAADDVATLSPPPTLWLVTAATSSAGSNKNSNSNSGNSSDSVVYVCNAVTGQRCMRIASLKPDVAITSLTHAPLRCLVVRNNNSSHNNNSSSKTRHAVLPWPPASSYSLSSSSLPPGDARQLLRVRTRSLVYTDYVWVGHADGSVRIVPASHEYVCAHASATSVRQAHKQHTSRQQQGRSLGDGRQALTSQRTRNTTAPSVASSSSSTTAAHARRPHHSSSSSRGNNNNNNGSVSGRSRTRSAAAAAAAADDDADEYAARGGDALAHVVYELPKYHNASIVAIVCSPCHAMASGGGGGAEAGSDVDDEAALQSRLSTALQRMTCASASLTTSTAHIRSGGKTKDSATSSRARVDDDEAEETHLSLVCTASVDSSIVVWDMLTVYTAIDDAHEEHAQRALCATATTAATMSTTAAEAAVSGVDDATIAMTLYKQRDTLSTHASSSSAAAAMMTVRSTCVFIKVRPLLRLKGGVAALKTMQWLSTTVTTANYTRAALCDEGNNNNNNNDKVRTARHDKQAAVADAAAHVVVRRARRQQRHGNSAAVLSATTTTQLQPVQHTTRAQRREEHRRRLRLSQDEMADVEAELRRLMPPLADEPVQTRRVHLLIACDSIGTLHMWELTRELRRDTAPRAEVCVEARSGRSSPSPPPPPPSARQRGGHNGDGNRARSQHDNNDGRVDSPARPSARTATSPTRNTTAAAAAASPRHGSPRSSRSVAAVTLSPRELRVTHNNTTATKQTKQKAAEQHHHNDDEDVTRTMSPGRAGATTSTTTTTAAAAAAAAVPSLSKLQLLAVERQRVAAAAAAARERYNAIQHNTHTSAALPSPAAVTSCTPLDTYHDHDNKSNSMGMIAATTPATAAATTVVVTPPPSTRRSLSALSSPPRSASRHHTPSPRATTTTTKRASRSRAPRASRSLERSDAHDARTTTTTTTTARDAQTRTSSTAATSTPPRRQRRQGQRRGSDAHARVNEYLSRTAACRVEFSTDGVPLTTMTAELPPRIHCTLRRLPADADCDDSEDDSDVVDSDVVDSACNNNKKNDDGSGGEDGDGVLSLLREPTPRARRRRALQNSFNALTRDKALFFALAQLRVFVALDGAVLRLRCVPRWCADNSNNNNNKKTKKKDDDDDDRDEDEDSDGDGGALFARTHRPLPHFATTTSSPLQQQQQQQQQPLLLLPWCATRDTAIPHAPVQLPHMTLHWYKTMIDVQSTAVTQLHADVWRRRLWLCRRDGAVSLYSLDSLRALAHTHVQPSTTAITTTTAATATTTSSVHVRQHGSAAGTTMATAHVAPRLSSAVSTTRSVMAAATTRPRLSTSRQLNTHTPGQHKDSTTRTATMPCTYVTQLLPYASRTQHAMVLCSAHARPCDRDNNIDNNDDNDDEDDETRVTRLCVLDGRSHMHAAEQSGERRVWRLLHQLQRSAAAADAVRLAHKTRYEAVCACIARRVQYLLLDELDRYTSLPLLRAYYDAWCTRTRRSYRHNDNNDNGSSSGSLSARLQLTRHMTRRRWHAWRVAQLRRAVDVVARAVAQRPQLHCCFVAWRRWLQRRRAAHARACVARVLQHVLLSQQQRDGDDDAAAAAVVAAARVAQHMCVQRCRARAFVQWRRYATARRAAAAQQQQQQQQQRQQEDDDSEDVASVASTVAHAARHRHDNNKSDSRSSRRDDSGSSSSSSAHERDVVSAFVDVVLQVFRARSLVLHFAHRTSANNNNSNNNNGNNSSGIDSLVDESWLSLIEQAEANADDEYKKSVVARAQQQQQQYKDKTDIHKDNTYDDDDYDAVMQRTRRYCVFVYGLLPLLQGALATTDDVLPHAHDAAVVAEVAMLFTGIVLCLDYVLADAARDVCAYDADTCNEEGKHDDDHKKEKKCSCSSNNAAEDKENAHSHSVAEADDGSNDRHTAAAADALHLASSSPPLSMTTPEELCARLLRQLVVRARRDVDGAAAIADVAADADGVDAFIALLADGAAAAATAAAHTATTAATHV